MKGGTYLTVANKTVTLFVVADDKAEITTVCSGHQMSHLSISIKCNGEALPYFYIEKKHLNKLLETKETPLCRDFGKIEKIVILDNHFLNSKDAYEKFLDLAKKLHKRVKVVVTENDSIPNWVKRENVEVEEVWCFPLTVRMSDIRKYA